MELLLFHVALAAALFFAINWIGNHAVEFGYASPTLFEDANESVAFNFVIRALAPAVFIVAVSAALVALGLEDARIGIWRTICVYYLMRGGAIFAVGRQELVSWPRFFVHSAAGIAVGWLAYTRLILPQQSLFPDLNTAGNELWLAILAFLYAVANKVQLPAELSVRRRNAFIRRRYLRARFRWGAIINQTPSDQLLRLLIHAVIIYEDYCRPPLIRAVERHWPWPRARTTGIMQVTSGKALSDDESARLGIGRLAEAWALVSADTTLNGSEILWKVLAGYNKDETYILRVLDVMEVIAIRIDQTYRDAYESMYETPVGSEASPADDAAIQAAVDEWIARQPDPKPCRSEATRRLIGKGLELDGA
jgi:hypothetical protein